MTTHYAIDWSTLEIRFDESSRLRFPGDALADDTNERIPTQDDLILNDNWIAVLGDIHGDVSALNSAVQACQYAGVRSLYQVGDFGYLYSSDPERPARSETDLAIDMILRHAWLSSGISLHVIDGNHDNHALWHRDQESRTPRTITDAWDHTGLPSMPIYHPRGSTERTVRFGGKNTDDEQIQSHRVDMSFLGGARSVNVFPADEDKREGIDFWYDEQPTEEDVEYLLENCPPSRSPRATHYLFTHDAPSTSHLQSNMSLPADVALRARNTRDLVDRAVNGISPNIVFHGHWHQLKTGIRYSAADDENGDPIATKIVCLPKEHEVGNLVFVNTLNDSVWIPQGYARRARIDSPSPADNDDTGTTADPYSGEVERIF